MNLSLWAIRRPVPSLAAFLVLCIVGLVSFRQLPVTVMPNIDIPLITIDLTQAGSAPMELSNQVTKPIEDRLSSLEGVEHIASTARDSYAQIIVQFSLNTSTEQALNDVKEAMTQISSELPDSVSEPLIQQMDVSTGAVLNYAVSDPDQSIQALSHIVDEVLIRDLQGVKVADTIRIATLGESEDSLAKYSVDGQRLPVVVRLQNNARLNMNELASLRVISNTGEAIPLGSVADISFAEGPGSIERYDRRFRVAVVAELADGAVLGPALEAIHATDTASNMPEGTSLQDSGDAEVIGEMFVSFGLAMGLGVLLVYVVLVILFNSFMTPITILLSLPLCIGGAIFALYLTGNSISLAVVIGFLMLMGIVTKNAIMLVDFALQGKERGLSCSESVLDAGHKRARPIVMTTIAMVAGMVPSALSIGEGGEFRSPMAIAVIGGLIFSTMLSLLFVPCVFSVLNSVRRRTTGALFTKLSQRRVTDGVNP